MKSLKTFIKEELDLDGMADGLHDDIEELNLRVVNSEDVLGKLDDIAFMVNKGRLYSATVPLSVLEDIWTKMQQWEERFNVWETPRSDKKL